MRQDLEHLWYDVTSPHFTEAIPVRSSHCSVAVALVINKLRITAARPDGIELGETHAGNAIRRTGLTVGEHDGA